MANVNEYPTDVNSQESATSGTVVSPNATFQERVEGMITYSVTAETTPTTLQLNHFIQDAVKDITFKWIAIKPQDAFLFQRVTPSQSSNEYSIGTAQIISVLRESGATDRWQDCRRIGADLIYDVTDVESVHYASKFNPAYFVSENGEISVFPLPDATGDKWKAYYLNVVPIEESPENGQTLDRESSGVKYFPDHLEYLIPLFASIKSLEAKLGEYSIAEEDQELVAALTPLLASYKSEYEKSFMFHAPQKEKAKA
tara:strand:+ start:932 stop:1699 length:768 start_codon:yes stop_codon:yes gene_type:complete